MFCPTCGKKMVEKRVKKKDMDSLCHIERFFCKGCDTIWVRETAHPSQEVSFYKEYE